MFALAHMCVIVAIKTVLSHGTKYLMHPSPYARPFLLKVLPALLLPLQIRSGSSYRMLEKAGRSRGRIVVWRDTSKGEAFSTLSMFLPGIAALTSSFYFPSTLLRSLSHLE